jgi:tetratricopeptide (TPR) repeat protein
MSKMVLWALFLFGCFSAAAQAFRVDSLERELSTGMRADSTRLDQLNDLAYYLRSTDPGAALRRANEAVGLARRIGDIPRLATALNYKGLAQSVLGNDSAALEAFGECLKIRTNRHDSAGMGSVLHNIGISYFNRSDYTQALEYQQNAYDLFQAIGHRAGIAACLNSLGVVFLYLSDFPRALQYYFQALRLHENTGDRQNIASAYTNIGLVYDHWGNYPKSLEYQRKALAIFSETKSLYEMQNCLSNMGNTFDNAGKADTALLFYQRALSINRQLDNQRGIAANLTNTGIVYNGLEKFDQALPYLQEARKRYGKLNDKYGMALTLSALAIAYLKGGNRLPGSAGSTSKRLALALGFQRQGIALAGEIRNLETESNGWEVLSDIYAQQGNRAKALSAYKTHISLRDSIFNGEKRAESTRISMQYAFDKKQAANQAKMDQQHALALAAIKRQRLIRNVVSSGALFVLTAIGLIFFFYKKKRDAESRRSEAELRVQVADMEMKALRAQMNPHFIFNSLNSIRDYISRHDTKTADEYLVKFARMMRLVLENSEHQQVKLAKDLQVLELYIQLEALRMVHKFTYKIEIDDTLDPDQVMVPPLILQPFVENSIWHGIALKKGKGEIRIEIKKEEDMIHCTVEDNGIGRTRDTVMGATPRKGSMGFKITQSRIDIINRLKKSQAEISLHDLTEGMRVDVRLPLAINTYEL